MVPAAKSISSTCSLMTSFIRIPVSIRMITNARSWPSQAATIIASCWRVNMNRSWLLSSGNFTSQSRVFFLPRTLRRYPIINTHAFPALAFLGQRRDEGLSDIFIDGVNGNILERGKQVLVNCGCHAVPSPTTYYVVHIVEPELSTVCKGAFA